MFWKKQSTEDPTVQLKDMSQFTSEKQDKSPEDMALIDCTEGDGVNPTGGLPSMNKAVEADNSSNKAQRRFFSSEDITISRSKTLTVIGNEESPRFRPLPDMVVHVPEKTSAFKLTANFNTYDAGYYSIHWRVKKLQDFHIPNGLHFVINVSYDVEPDISGSLDVIMLPDRLNGLEKDQWYNLVLEDKLIIQPHEGVAKVELILCNNEKPILNNNENPDRYEYSGLVIEHVEIRPIILQGDKHAEITDVIVSKAAIPKFVIDSADAFPVAQDATGIPSAAQITRLSSSKASRYLASLSLSQNYAYIAIWDMSTVPNPSLSSPGTSEPSKKIATAVIHHRGIGQLSIGLSLSTTGDLVAVYQEPKIGQWVDGSKAEKPTFPFRLFSNPLVPQPAVVLDMDTSSDRDPEGVYGLLAEHETATSRSSPAVIELQEFHYENEILAAFIGYGAFLPERSRNEWEIKDAPTPSVEENNFDAEEDLEDGRNETDGPASSSMFVACNGLYLDVFRISPDKKWIRAHTITLTDLLPTLSRRITCKMMMDTISSNTFMWLEDGGRSCTIWNLLTGSNITHISSIENARFKGATFRGHCKMAFSPDETIVALASVDGSLATYFKDTGMSIDERSFPGFKIEYVGFHGHEDHLFLILRDSVTFGLSTMILDPLRLKCETTANQVPIPTIGSTILAFFNVNGFWNRGIICEADGTKINCYISHQPTKPKVNKSSESVLQGDPNVIEYQSRTDENIWYRLKTGIHRELLFEGEGVAYWVLRVELLEENQRMNTKKVVFSFVPEPWIKSTTAEVAHPENLLTAYFIPGGARFAVIGMQSLQIWNLPSSKNVKCSLQFFWSHPKDEMELGLGGSAYKSEGVRDYYVETSKTLIFLDTETGNAIAEIKLNDKTKKKTVPIPDALGNETHHAFLYCFRSIHLLAAAYAFSSCEGKKAIIRASPQLTFTFEDHAEAIVRFVLEYINRVITVEDYTPQKGGLQQANTLRHKKSESVIDAKSIDGKWKSIGRKSSRNKATVPEVVTLLTLLLNHDYLFSENNVFVEALLSSANGEWIPRSNKALNPIKRVIETKNTQLLDAFIEYCIKNAKQYHPAYLMPAVQCLKELSERYPDVLADLFRKASYIPARNHEYVASHAIVANLRYPDWLNFLIEFYTNGFFKGTYFKKSNNIDDYERPVFCLRSQLPVRATTFLNIKSIETSIRETRLVEFPPKRNIVEDEKQARSKYSHQIYVCPFPKLSSYGRYLSWYESDGTDLMSVFTMIAGKEFFDSPAMEATLSFKWNKFGFMYWFIGFLVDVMFFAFITAITAQQVRKATLPEKGSPTPEEIVERYLLSWHLFIKFTIAVGSYLIFRDAVRLLVDWRQYIRSPYLYMRLVAHILPIIGCSSILKAHPSSEATDPGPSQIWVMSFAILALYLNMLFEMRVIKQLGIVVNIILNIMRKIVWFFLIFGVFLVAFTHALLHLLHTRKYDACEDGCEDRDYPDGYPKKFFDALSATYFFLAGRFDPISTSFDKGTTSFLIMMMIFFFFTTILLLNIFIALMNDAFNESSVQGEVAWLKQWSEVVADVEVFYMSNTSHHNHNFFPDYIYYGASEKDAEVYGSQYYIANKSNLSLENRFVVEAVSAEQNTIQMAQRGIIHDVQKMERQQDIATQEIAEMRELMKQTRDELLSEMRRLMAAPANQKNVLTEGNEQSATSSPVTQGPSISVAPPTPGRAQHQALTRVAAGDTSNNNSIKYTKPTQGSTGDLWNQLPASGYNMRFPESSFSKSSRDISSPDREKVIQNKTSSSSVLNQRQQQNLDAIYTADDSRKAQQRLEDNNASHPVYVKPQEHQDNNSDSDDSENEDKNDKSTPYQSSPSHVPRYHSQRDQTQHYPQQQDPPRRAQSDGQLTSLPHEVVE